MTSVTREQLFNEIWAAPMTTVAKRYNVSSNYLARVCHRMGLPRPSRGYWARLKFGKKVTKPPLPRATIEHPPDWTPGGSENDQWHSRLPNADVSAPPLPAKPPRTPSEHPLIAGAEALLMDSRESSWDESYPRPQKAKVVDIWASRTGIPPALKLANRLFLALEHRGHRVLFAPHYLRLRRVPVECRAVAPKRDPYTYSRHWSPSQPTVVFIGDVAFGLTVFEISEEAEVAHRDGAWVRVTRAARAHKFDPRAEWTTRRQMPTGKLGLHVYSPYIGLDWERYWRETDGGALSTRFEQISMALESTVPEIGRMAEATRKHEEEMRLEQERHRREWERQERERRQAESLKASRDHLLGLVETWARARRIEDFLEDIAQGLAKLPVEERAEVSRRLNRARDLFGGPEALKHFLAWRTPEER